MSQGLLLSSHEYVDKYYVGFKLFLQKGVSLPPYCTHTNVVVNNLGSSDLIYYYSFKERFFIIYISQLNSLPSSL